MKFKTDKDGIAGFLLAVFVFFLPFLQRISVICIVALIVVVLVSGNLKVIVTRIREHRFFLFLIAYYTVHLFGLLYSENMEYGLFDVQVKLSFLIFPLILPAINWNRKLIDFIKKSFVAGCFTACIVCIGFSIKAYASNHEINDFFYSRFSHFLHPTYITVYLNLAVLFVLHELFANMQTIKPFSKALSIAIVFFFLINIILISSRTGSFVAYFTILVYLVINLFKNGFSLKKVLLLAGIVILIGSIHLGSLRYYDRYSELKTEYREEKQKINSPEPEEKKENVENENSASVRVKLWYNAWELIKDHPFTGVGTGDIKDELVTYYKRNNWKYGVETRHNPHNQYMHTTVILGIVGLGVLLLNLIVPLFSAFKRKNWIYFFFLSVIILNALTESILEVQNGILFFTFFTCLFYIEMEPGFDKIELDK